MRACSEPGMAWLCDCGLATHPCLAPHLSDPRLLHEPETVGVDPAQLVVVGTRL